MTEMTESRERRFSDTSEFSLCVIKSNSVSSGRPATGDVRKLAAGRPVPDRGARALRAGELDSGTDWV
jgi:hypothetical protein